MKTLLVRYTPRNERSKSKALLDAFRSGIRNSEIDELDLCQTLPRLFDPVSVEAYYARNLTRRALSASEATALAPMLELTARLKAADIVALAFPMFNFSLPAAVKAWFDSVLHVGETIDPGGGAYHGLMSGKRALVMVAAGGLYSAGDGRPPRFGQGWEHAVTLARLEFQFMGYSDIRSVLAEGMAMGDPALAAQNLNEAVRDVHAIADAWYPR